MNKLPRLLVVDDEIDICNFVKSFFEMRGFKVSIALNGDEAMEKLAKDAPDVVIMDLKMRREGEGLEYLPKIKAAQPSVRVLMVTATDDSDTIEKAKQLGADDYITKPLMLEYLENTVLEKVKHLK